ncbi:hypothetical protein JAB5_51630 [Janthinobacterium sp. HH103]|uniref:hypothetical protein n=1 Tax=Janthinobacterium TaxID=29580 RepID=UPI0008939C3A|nr:MULTISPECIES: hypothetical protein [Janthinobacterium]MCC7684582.1 hypothetical protein [Janthinobacterium sp. FW305-128]OEZ58999.1 hypothetical protein JAB2_48920 [Janthinobacterium sp. HH100]OEZ68108.1 hypothetical protein JAB5_51630 [Janthinobacterium sp. HH103]OEZ82605.1 hypothetical protein JAB8_46710 [Janthinobacterium sp. HH106]OFA03578.1 hypothetical protein JAB9_10960 [Janthinobacterium sp. HH107]
MRIHALRPGSSLQALSRHATQALYLCASLNPALAGLPHLMEYLWNYMITVWHPTSK